MVYNHINNCDRVKYLVDLLNIDQAQTERDTFDKKIYVILYILYTIHTVKEIISIIDKARRWDIFLFKEALQTKEINLTLNNGLTASRESKLF